MTANVNATRGFMPSAMRPAFDLVPQDLSGSAQIPLIEPWIKDFLGLLKENASPFRLLRNLTPFINQIQTVSPPSADLLKKLMHSEARDAWDVFHTIPRKLLHSIILGTVAYDVYRDSKNLYEDKGSGVYVLGLSIDRRDGEFLTGSEIRQVASALEKYLSVFQLKQDKLSVSPALERFSHDVDNAYGGYPKQAKLRFIQNGNQYQFGRSLVSSMRRRADEAYKHDPTGNTCTIQSPLYVGCSDKLENRRKNYRLHGVFSALSNTNKMYAFLVSVLRKVGFEPRWHFVTVVRVWNSDQLSVGEILVAALASAYVEQCGFNTRDAGGKKPKKLHGAALDGPKRHVFYSRPWLSMNLKWSENDMSQIEKLLAVVDKLNKAARELEATDWEPVRSFLALLENIDGAREGAEETHKQFLEAVETYRKEHALLTEFVEHLKATFANMDRTPDSVTAAAGDKSPTSKLPADWPSDWSSIPEVPDIYDSQDEGDGSPGAPGPPIYDSQDEGCQGLTQGIPGSAVHHAPGEQSSTEKPTVPTINKPLDGPYEDIADSDSSTDIYNESD